MSFEYYFPEEVLRICALCPFLLESNADRSESGMIFGSQKGGCFYPLKVSKPFCKPRSLEFNTRVKVEKRPTSSFILLTTQLISESMVF